MIFMGSNEIRFSRETIQRTLIDSLNNSLIRNTLEPIHMTYHRNGDISIIVEQEQIQPVKKNG